MCVCVSVSVCACVCVREEQGQKMFPGCLSPNKNHLELRVCIEYENRKNVTPKNEYIARRLSLEGQKRVRKPLNMTKTKTLHQFPTPRLADLLTYCTVQRLAQNPPAIIVADSAMKFWRQGQEEDGYKSS